MEEDPLQKKYNQLYLEIILRYKDYIEQNENLNVAELPKLITPDDEKVVSLSNKIKSAFNPYSYPKNFVEAAKVAYDYVAHEISTISLPIEFWLYPSDTIKCEAGDLFDKATLLCSLLIAFGNASAKVITAVRPSGRRFIVYCEFEDRIMAVDLDREFIHFESREKLVDSLRLDDEEDITSYEFNDKMYKNLV